MPTISESFSAGETKRYNVRGGFFRLLECSLDRPVDITLWDSESGYAEDLTAVKSGIAYTGPFDYVTIKSSYAQDVQFIVASGRVEYARDLSRLRIQNAAVGSNLASCTHTSYGNATTIKWSASFRTRAADPASYFKVSVNGIDRIYQSFGNYGSVVDLAFEGEFAVQYTGAFNAQTSINALDNGKCTIFTDEYAR